MGEKLQEKIIFMKKLCPICKKDFVYFCFTCRNYILSSVNKSNYVYKAMRNTYCFPLKLKPHMSYTKSKNMNFFLYQYKISINKTISNNSQSYGNFYFIYEIDYKEFTLIHKDNDELSLSTVSVNHRNTTSNLAVQGAEANKVLSFPNVKTKRSSNILTALVKKAKRKIQKSPPELQIKHVATSALNVSENEDKSSTSLGLQMQDEEEIKCEQMDGNLEIATENHETLWQQTDSEMSTSSITKSKNYFKKFIKKTNSTENKNKCVKNQCKQSPDIPLTSFLPIDKITLPMSLTNGLHVLQEITANLRDSENHFIQIISKFIKDQALQKELVDTLSQHCKLQWEAERRTSGLANDMWVHQIEIGRSQERSLQDMLNSIIKQNRQLQIDNEIMYRRHEKLVYKIRGFQDISIKTRCVECNSQIENILSHNEKLQMKLEAYVQQIENLENEIKNSQKENDGLEDQIRLATSQIQNLRGVIHRIKTDYELELVTVDHKLQKKDQIIKETIEAGDVLLDDLDSIKRQFKIFELSLNWTKFKCRGNCVTDLIHMCRSCINEISKELMASYTQISLKDKDLEALRQSNARLQENLQKSTTELNIINKKIDSSAAFETEKVVAEQKCKYLETDIRSLKEKIESIRVSYETEIEELHKKLSESEHLNKEITEKDKMIEQTKLFITNIATENCALRSQVEGLNQLLSETGAGDVAKKMGTKEEGSTYFNNQFHELLDEKDFLLREIELLQSDNQVLISNEKTNSDRIGYQMKVTEKLNKEVVTLTQQLEAEKNTVASLQNERMKYLEEKNVLKSMFSHMKNEMDRNQKLESTVADITKEATRLAMIAEYNKQMGEKLKNDVIERDNTISELQTSVSKLNHLQIKNNKHKLSLVHELTEISNVRNELNNILKIQVQKNKDLGLIKKEVVNSAASQLKKYEYIQQTERAALMDLLQDYKIVVEERDKLLKAQKVWQQDVDDWRKKIELERQQYNQILFTLKNKEHLIIDLKKKQEDYKNKVSDLECKLESNNQNLQKHINEYEETVKKLTQENGEKDNSIKYLQNNTQKLHSDLNEARKNEKETKDELKSVILEKRILENSIQTLECTIESLKGDKIKLANEVENLNRLCEKILSDFEGSIEVSTEKEDFFKSEIDSCQEKILNYKVQLDNLEQTNRNKESENNRLLHECTELTNKLGGMNKELKKYEEQDKILHQIIEEKKSIESKVQDSKLQLENYCCQLNLANCTITKLQEEINEKKQEKQKTDAQYHNKLQQMLTEHENCKKELKTELDRLNAQIKELTSKLEHERSAYTTLSQIHKDVSGKFLNSIKQLVEEKNSRDEITSKLNESNNTISALEHEKDNLKNQISEFMEQIRVSKEQINELLQEKQDRRKTLNSVQKMYNAINDKCMDVENELKNIQECPTSTPQNDQEKFTSDLGNTEERVNCLERELNECHKIILHLKDDVFKLQTQITGLEFEKSEITFRLRETEGKLVTEQDLCEQMKNTHQLILAAILQMKDEGKIEPCDCKHLSLLMDFIPSNKLEKYDDILQKINCEFDKYEKLRREIEIEENQIIISKLAQNDLSANVCHVNVKIFSDIFELYSLYQSEISKKNFENLTQHSQCKFYLIEIYVSKILYQKVIDLESFLNISIYTSICCIQKSVKLPISSLPIVEVIPIDNSILECTVEVYLLSRSENFLFIKLGTVKVDISYHFSREKSNHVSKTVFQIGAIYNYQINFKQITTFPQLDYEISCNVHTDKFIKTFLNNSYHKLDIELFSEFNNDSCAVFMLSFFVGVNKCCISYNKQSKSLTIKGNVSDLFKLKRYFLREFNGCSNEMEDKNSFIEEIKSLLQRDYGGQSVQAICKLYEDTRKLWKSLPL